MKHKPTLLEPPPTMLVLILTVCALTIVAAFLLNQPWQKNRCAAERQTIQNLKCDIEVLQHELWVAEANNPPDRTFTFSKMTNMTHKDICDLLHIPYKDKKSFCVQISNLSVSCNKTFTNYFEYPPKFLLKD